MEVAGFIISIFALVIGILALVLSMRALYIIGVNAGLDKQFEPQANTCLLYTSDAADDQ